MSVIAIEQPNYIPWVGYFDLIRQSDIFVWYDDVQYTPRDWRNRNRVAAGGTPLWLTVPVLGRSRQPISGVKIHYDGKWQDRHLRTVERFYGKSPHFGEVYEVFEKHLRQSPSCLADLTIALCEDICRLLGLCPHFVRASEIEGVEGARQDRLLSIIERFPSSAYLSGPLAKDYIVPDRFSALGIELRYMVYDYPPYTRGRFSHIPALSILDILFWQGPEFTAAYLRDHGKHEVV